MAATLHAPTAGYGSAKAAPSRKKGGAGTSVPAAAAASGDADNALDAQEELLASLVESQQLGPALKAIFDRGWTETYDKKLTSHIAKKDAEVKTICHSHYEVCNTHFSTLVRHLSA